MVSDEMTFGDNQPGAMTALMRFTKNFNPDYLIPLDADEFLDVPNRKDLEAVLEMIPEGGAGRMPWKTYVLTETMIPEWVEYDPPRSFRWRRAVERPQYWKSVIRADGVDLEDRTWFRGSHDVGVPSGRAIPSVVIPLHLLHYPVRSREQFVGKTIVNWMASEYPGFQRLIGYDKIMGSPEGISDQELIHLSLNYAQTDTPEIMLEPKTFNYTRKYSTGHPMMALQLVAREWKESRNAVAR
jgi:hypothetical protein